MRGQRLRREPFFLIVKMKLMKDTVKEFAAKMPSLRETFAKNKFELLLAGISEPPDGENPVAIHLWHMPSADLLLQGMALLADVVPYTQIDDLILDEEQDLGTPSQTYATLEAMLKPWRDRHIERPGKSDRYLTVTETVKGPELAEYGARYESSLTAFNDKHGWQLGQGLLRITGQLNRVSRAWVVPGDLTESEAQEILETSPGAGCVKQRDKLYFLNEASYEAGFSRGVGR